MIAQPAYRFLKGFFIICLLTLAWFYYRGYKSSIDWQVTTVAEAIEYPAIEIAGELLDFKINGEKYLLTEAYTGGRIQRNVGIEAALFGLSWLGLGIVLSCVSFLKRFVFLAVIVLTTLLINRLNLAELGLFGSRNPVVVGIIPFLLLVGPLYFFHGFYPKAGFFVRFSAFILSTVIIVVLGVADHRVFLDHIQAHSVFTFGIAGVIFLFIISEEIIFAILYLVTLGKGGNSNHIHFMILCLIYLANLALYYLNKSGFVPNAFSFFDPYLFLILSGGIALWSLNYKAGALDRHVDRNTQMAIFLGLGILFFSYMSLAFAKGADAVYESFHYFILYFHIGFGTFFFLYVVVNFIDPLVLGLKVYRIVYTKQHFPYISARLGGIVIILGVYFLSTQEAYDLLRSGYYVNLGNKEMTLNDPDMAAQYYQQASFLGYNTHYSNYQLAWLYSDKGNEHLTKMHFRKATSRFPSPFAYVNYATLDQEINSVESEVFLDRAALRFGSGEIHNNLGLLKFKNRNWDEALSCFKKAKRGGFWNQAPLLNQWAVLYRFKLPDSLLDLSTFKHGNYGVYANILAVKDSTFDFQGNLSNAPTLHRQAFLLNAATIFLNDTLSHLIARELKNSTNTVYNDRLRKALAIRFYKKGDVNEAFKVFDHLAVNLPEKNSYLNELGILAMDQGAVRLSIDYFDRAATLGNEHAKINRLEALAAAGESQQIPGELIGIVQKNPDLTAMANLILSDLRDAKFGMKTFNNPPELGSFSSDTLIYLAAKNAFNEELVIQSVRLLTERGLTDEAYSIVLGATEINPFSAKLLQCYALTALDYHLVEYAEQVLPQVKILSNKDDYILFKQKYDQKKDALSLNTW